MSGHQVEVIEVKDGFVARCLTCPSWSTEPSENEWAAQDDAEWHRENGDRLSGEVPAIACTGVCNESFTDAACPVHGVSAFLRARLEDPMIEEGER